MEMNVASLGERAIAVALEGRLDTAGVGLIETRFNAGAIAPGRPLLLDLAGVSFVSSLGVRLLITAAKALKLRSAPFVMHVPAGPVREMLVVAGIDALIPMFETREAAEASILQH